jgi:hypothetical protein
VIHALNRDYVAGEDRMTAATGVRIGVPASLVSRRKSAKLLSYDAKPLQVPLTVEGASAFVTLPTLNLWTVVVIE